MTAHDVGTRQGREDMEAFCRTCGVIADPLLSEEASAWVWGHLAAGPPSSLPAVLSSVEDVARVCEAAGLTPDGFGNWDADGIRVEARDDQGWHIVLRGGLGADLDYGYPTAVLWSAIQAARGGAS